ncbi:EamA family transporter [Bifidobacterium xylocopae]|uniref:EamA family transporter n=2 Tax=Bifidobacterium xylocopae TaxID=2493119 RepID=A0A366KD54_9BIFI|nr:EamA family transporter [Bifidobacterium xylocopae]
MLRAGFGKLYRYVTLSFPPSLARILLLCCAALWGGSYLMAKVAISAISPQWLMFLRMSGACLLMLAAFHKRILPHLKPSVILPSLAIGGTYYLHMCLQTIALRDEEPGRSAFLTASYCVLTPFAIWAIFRHRPRMVNIIAALVCLVGVGFVALKPGSASLSLSGADVMTLGCALAYAFNLALMAHFARSFSPLSMTFMQFAVAGACFLVGALLTEPAPSAAWFRTPVILSFLYLVLCATFAAQIMQNVGLAHVAAGTASIILCTESLFSVGFSAIFMGERITTTSLIGFVLIFSAILLSVVHFGHRVPKPVPKPQVVSVS